MTLSTISVPVPEPLYRRLERVATLTRRSITDMLASAITVVLPPAPDLPEPLADELAGMMWLSDTQLRAATRPTFTLQQQKRLNELNDAADERPLTESEQAERARLLAEYKRSVLRRTQAFAVLTQRGHRTPKYTELANKSHPLDCLDNMGRWVYPAAVCRERCVYTEKTYDDQHGNEGSSLRSASLASPPSADAGGVEPTGAPDA